MMKRAFFLAASVYCLANVGAYAQEESAVSESPSAPAATGSESGGKRAWMAKKASDMKQGVKDKWHSGKEHVKDFGHTVKEKVTGPNYDNQ